MRFISLFLLLSVEAKIFQTRQPASSVRWITKNGQITIYQNHLGALFFSKNYKTNKIYQGPPHTNFMIKGHGRNFVISIDSYYHILSDLHYLKKIMVLDPGELQPRNIGTGINPAIHLNGYWMSYFNPLSNQIFFVNLDIDADRFSIQLKNNKFKYYLPKVTMISKDEIIYTDMNKDGVEAMILYDRAGKKVKILYKTPDIGPRLELCYHNKYLIYGQFGKDEINKGSKIYILDLMKSKDLRKAKVIYRSEHNDIGQILCQVKDDTIYFIKNEKNKSYVIEKNYITNKDHPIKMKENITNILHMDGRVLTHIDGELHLLMGSKLELDDKVYNEDLPQTSKN